MSLEPSKSNNNEVDLEVMRHSFAHVLAMATLRLYPGTKLGIGPATKDGFYYEFEFSKKLTKEDLPKIEDEIRKIIAEEIPFKQIMVEREQAFNTLIQLGQIFKTELLQSIPDEKISFYKTGEDFIDMCRGPHVSHTGQLGVFKLTAITDIHWFGDISRPVMQKIEGIAFGTAEQMAEYEQRLVNIKMRDHRKLGGELLLFENQNWFSKGLIIKNLLKSTVENKLSEIGYKAVETPATSDGLFRKSFATGHIEIFKSRRRSYKDLPIRFFETGPLQHTLSETSYGLFDISPVSSTEAFSFTAPYNLQTDLQAIIKMNMELYSKLELSLSSIQLCVPDLTGIELSDKEKKVLNDYFQMMKTILIESEIDVDIVTKQVFIYYDPYISFNIKDINDREWDIGRITIVFDPKLIPPVVTNTRNNQEKINIVYDMPIVSYERLVAYLIESTNGALPLWLSPTQVDLLSISEKYNQYVQQLSTELTKEGIRNIYRIGDETIHTKIRKSQMQKTPYMLIIGEKEIKTNSVSVRNRDGQELGLIRIDEFIGKLKSEINIEKSPTV